MNSQKRRAVATFFAAGTIDKQQIPMALRRLGLMPDKRVWLRLFDQILLASGIVAMALSMIFFIAYNWSDMGRFSKFLLLEASIILSVMLYCYFVARKLVSRMALLLASLLVGALMAFYGQTYQTGADSWQLFFYWALAITPWVVISRFSSLWLLWLMLLNLALVLYFDTFHSIFGLVFDAQNTLFWCLFGLNSLALLIWEWCSKKMVALTERWPQRVIAIISGWAITALAIYVSLDKPEEQLLPLLIWVAWLVIFMVAYRQFRLDIFMLAGGCLSAILVIMTLLGQHIIESGDEAALLLLSVLIMAMGAGAAYWLKQVHRESES
ncbi:DUF2157 domain-containing protein [Methylophaga sp.]|uniref:DUF2157 domain-containing protein n=2 Tax=unclassified Methylophaga TaxID=2629249 RepID=UPI003A907349